ncbi:hypothetical protein C9374_014092 [Naegleria lovaniensis]|uniref:Transmembrane protein n=1 Tax=Naegleria lovaniensis TaxID=51637 RepID=A0AA88KV01_NAELO|nr:uncharacterized protein C9374_014092 [Naegleria lovaniensis]KAG2389532.1 hypothetical protein C9374_014092 [Naegleria lovaniensis]
MQQSSESQTPSSAVLTSLPTASSNSFTKKEWSQQVMKKTLVGVGMAASVGLVLGVMRKRGVLNNSPFFKQWQIGMKLRKSKNIGNGINQNSSGVIPNASVSETATIEMVPSVFRTTIAFAGNIGLSCYLYFCIEEYLTLKQIVPERCLAHFVTACGMYTTASFTKKLLMKGLGPNAALTIPYYLVRSLTGGLTAGCVALCASLIGSSISYNFQLKKLKRNISEEEYLSLVGVTKEEAQKTLTDKLMERLPVWLKTPSAQDRNLLDEMKKFHSLRQLELSLMRKKQEAGEEQK